MDREIDKHTNSQAKREKKAGRYRLEKKRRRHAETK